MEYLSEETAVQNIPVLRMIAMPLDEIEKEVIFCQNLTPYRNGCKDTGRVL